MSYANRPPLAQHGPKRLPFRVGLPHAKAERGRFVLSLDGGGIYGLTSAIWLRQIAEREPRFLAFDEGERRMLLVGCSSGAINALHLAMHEDPRKTLLDGELETFWKDEDVWANSDPLSRIGSNLGLAPYFGTDDFLKALERVFGQRTLGELHFPVLISTYNWTGEADAERSWLTPGQAFEKGIRTGDWSAFVVVPPTPATSSRAGQTTRHWRPKFFDNAHDDDDDLNVRVLDVAYAAAAPPGFRALRGGLGDGASFNANPSVNAIGYLVECWEKEVDLLGDDELRAELRQHGEAPGSLAGLSRKDLIDQLCAYRLGLMLRDTAMISMGSGQDLPHYGFSNSGFGFGLFQAMPTNPFVPVWPSPSFYSLDAATTDAEFIARQLLTKGRYLRVNPDVNKLPTLMAALVARQPILRAQLTADIEQNAVNERSQAAVEQAVFFLRKALWNEDDAQARKGLQRL